MEKNYLLWFIESIGISNANNLIQFGWHSNTFSHTRSKQRTQPQKKIKSTDIEQWHIGSTNLIFYYDTDRLSKAIRSLWKLKYTLRALAAKSSALFIRFAAKTWL